MNKHTSLVRLSASNAATLRVGDALEIDGRRLILTAKHDRLAFARPPRWYDFVAIPCHRLSDWQLRRDVEP
jgi:hypothetical protein